MRVKIVINHHQHQGWSVRRVLWHLTRFGARAWDEMARWMGIAATSLRHALCGLSGHQDVLRLQRQRMALACSRCGRVTRGWDLTDPTPPAVRAEAPHYLELVRRRSS